jgi:hypothetical protein
MTFISTFPREMNMPAAENGPAESAPEPDETEVPLNRAERRAKGKHKDQQHLNVSKINPGKSAQSHAQRNFSSRRSGG